MKETCLTKTYGIKINLWLVVEFNRDVNKIPERSDKGN